MAAHGYGLRSRVNGPSVSLNGTPTASSLPKTGTRLKPAQGANLSLQSVIGTTTSNSSGFSCHAPSNTFAYCAGSTVVLAKVQDPDGEISQRFFKAHPSAGAIHPYIPYYHAATPNGTPNKRKATLPARSVGHSTVVSGSPSRERADDGSTQTWTARERIKATTCVSLSPDGRFLAVGEKGYNPRVLLFSMAVNLPFDLPLSIVSEHTFGVRAVAFSPDSRFLATLGDINDGFLLIWSVSPKNGDVRLHSANKLTANVNSMTWCGNSIITVGTRHVKVWRVADSSRSSPDKGGRLKFEAEGLADIAPMTLSGRNCILGSLADSTFTCAIAVSDHEAVLCTDRGQICFLDDADQTQLVKPVKSISGSISSVSVNYEANEIYLAGETEALIIEDMGTFRELASRALTPDSLSQLLRASSEPPRVSHPSAPSMPRKLKSNILAVGCLSKGVVTIDRQHTVQYDEHGLSQQIKHARKIAAHNEPVQGLHLMPYDNKHGAFVTWCLSGIINFWDRRGHLLRSQLIDLDQSPKEKDDRSNELTQVHYLATSDSFVSGDRLGVLRLTKIDEWTMVYKARAHSAHLSEICSEVVASDTLFASCGRDRMVQLFRALNNKAELIQTMDDHAGAVSTVKFTRDGGSLISASVDRTIIIRDRILRDLRADKGLATAYLTSKIITLKASPVSMALLDGASDVLAVSTMDRHIVKVNLATGNVQNTFKVADPDTDDTAVLNSVCLSRASPDTESRLLVGYSSTDKCIRVYDFDKNTLLTRASGHSEGVSSVALLEEAIQGSSLMKRTIISTGLDSTIMMWNLLLGPCPSLATQSLELSRISTGNAQNSDATPSKATLASLPPLRKILSKVDVENLSRGDSVIGSSMQLRNNSPDRLRQKTSRNAVVVGKVCEDGGPTLSPSTGLVTTSASGGDKPQHFPSPPLSQLPSPERKNQRARIETSTDLRPSKAKALCRSPAPETSKDTRLQLRSNNARLPRPPPVPSDPHVRDRANGQRRSLSNANEFGGIGLTNEQMGRVLRTYRWSLERIKDRPTSMTEMDEIEKELETTLRAVRGVKARMVAGGEGSGQVDEVGNPTEAAKAPTESDVENLAILLENTVMAEERLGGEGEGNK